MRAVAVVEHAGRVGRGEGAQQVPSVLARRGSVEGGDRRKVARAIGTDAGVDRAVAGRPGASRIRYQVWTSNPSRSYIGRPASVATRTSVRHPAASAVSIVARVIAIPTPRRRQAGSTKIVPIQATGPFTLRTPVPTTAPSASATIGWVSGWLVDELEVAPPIAPVVAEERGGDRVDVGGRSSAGWSGVAPADRSGRVRYHRAMATLSRSEVEHVAHLARLGLTDAELTRLEAELNHILDQYAILAELPTDDIPPTAQTIELENILREDVVRPSLPVEAVLANAPGPRRRLHRRPGHPRRALIRCHDDRPDAAARPRDGRAPARPARSRRAS